MMPSHHNRKPQTPKEEYAIVLDVVLSSQSSFKDDEIAQALGTTGFTLLELVPKQGVILKAGDKVYIGEGKRDEVQYIKRAINPEKLSGGAKSELEFTLMDIIDDRAEEFINFFNNAGPITIRKHSLELIPGIGKKHLGELLEERDNGPFKDFNDLKTRCPFISDPQKALADRIMKEMDDIEDFRIFVRK